MNIIDNRDQFSADRLILLTVGIFPTIFNLNCMSELKEAFPTDWGTCEEINIQETILQSHPAGFERVSVHSNQLQSCSIESELKRSQLSPYSSPWIPHIYQNHNPEYPIDSYVGYPVPRICESADGFVYQVRFKHSSRYYLLAPPQESQFGTQLQSIKNGEYVKVEADRGEDIGFVVSKTPLIGFKVNKLTVGRYGQQCGDYKCVLQRATIQEVSLLALKDLDERSAVNVSVFYCLYLSIAPQICSRKSLESHFHLNILDAEFQFDRQKLTFFFEAKKLYIHVLLSSIFDNVSGGSIFAGSLLICLLSIKRESGCSKSRRFIITEAKVTPHITINRDRLMDSTYRGEGDDGSALDFEDLKQECIRLSEEDVCRILFSSYSYQ
jgi:hypothetical protein